MGSIRIPTGLRGSIYQRGKDSFRVQLSLGRNANGEYEIKRETIRGQQQDAIDLLTRWNVQYLDHTIQATNRRTVEQAYEEWIAHIAAYRTPNTARFYRQRFELDLLPELGHKRLQDLTLSDLQKALALHTSTDKHNKRALSAFLNWCADMGHCPRHDLRRLKTKARARPKSEQDVWTFDQVRKVYSALSFDNLYDVFIVLGVECGLRPQEAMALTWDKIQSDHLVIDSAVKERTPGGFDVGVTKTEQARAVATTPYLIEKLTQHKVNQELRIVNTAGYNRSANLIVADAMGNVPDLNYIRKYMRRLAKRANVHYIPPKNLRSTYISLMNDLGIPLPIIQQAAGHSSPDVTSKHYIRIFNSSLKEAATLYHERLHG
ncbi:MAG: Phage integrase family protein [Firmicutes bacterium ADurb.BinA052]|jgi:integrase|nr:MAG: Phage integrase family protein [Firmicutes bacterium ADurb.BinA052]